jgi:hypothetical protein
MQQLDMIISKMEQMVQGKQVDPEEILMDLKDYKSMCNGEDTGEESQSSPEGISGMIDQMRGQK